MKNLNSIYFLALVFGILALSSCNKDEPEIIDEPELIIEMIINFTPAAGGESKVFSFSDEDGDGGNEPIISADVLDANTVYNAEVQISTSAPDTPSGSEDITSEIIEEADEHQFFYQASSSLNLSTAYEDMDGNSLPVGQKFSVTTGEPSLGELTVTLRHQPDKSAEGVEEGDISNAGGESDIEVTFAVSIE